MVDGGAVIDELAARRAGRREANLRSLNERIADAQEDAGSTDDLQLVCECALADCDAGIVVPASRFEQLREDDLHYLVVPGHVIHEVEHEVAHGDGWVMVEKFGAAAGAATREANR